MPYQRKYDFQPGTKASSSQVDEELDNLILAVNNIEAEVTTKETPIEAQKKADAAKTAAVTEAVNASVQHTAGTKKMMLQKYSSGTITVPPNSYAGVTIPFDTAFAEVPVIVDGMNTSATALNCSVAMGAVTTTNANVWVYNSHPTATRYIIVNLLVYGVKSL